jgi:hypothetical protein
MNIAGKRLSNGDLAIAGGLLVGLISVFLPWYSVSENESAICGGLPGCSNVSFSSSVSAFGLWAGWLFFLVLIVGIVLFVLRTFVPGVNVALPVVDNLIYTVVGGAMIVLALLWFVTNPGGASGPGFSAGPSFGLFIGIVAGAAVAIGGILKRSDPQPTTKPLSAYQTPSAPPPPASPPPPPSV